MIKYNLPAWNCSSIADRTNQQLSHPKRHSYQEYLNGFKLEDPMIESDLFFVLPATPLAAFAAWRICKFGRGLLATFMSPVCHRA